MRRSTTCRRTKKINWGTQRPNRFSFLAFRFSLFVSRYFVFAMQHIRNFIQFVSRHAARIALFGGGALLLLSFVVAFIFPALFFRAYLVAFVFWLGIGLGCLVILMLYHLASGAWGAVLVRILEAGARTLPWLTLLGLPLYLSIPTLFVWAQPEMQSDPLTQHQAPYLNIPFFIARTILYFAIWNGMAFLFNRWSRELEENPTPLKRDRLRRAGALGLVIFGITVTFAAIDWIMSLEPAWYSTIFAAIVAMGGVLSSFAFVILVFVILARRPPLSSVSSPQLLNDLGNVLLAFVMTWAYLAFSQYLLIWMGNLAAEIPYYLKRMNGGWQIIMLVVGLLYFVLPFGLLIFRSVKRHTWLLGLVALMLVLTRWLEVVWLIVPVFEPTLVITWLDVITTLGMGGVYLALFARELHKRPLLIEANKHIQEAEEWTRETRAAPRKPA